MREAAKNAPPRTVRPPRSFRSCSAENQPASGAHTPPAHTPQPPVPARHIIGPIRALTPALSNEWPIAKSRARFVSRGASRFCDYPLCFVGPAATGAVARRAPVPYPAAVERSSEGVDPIPLALIVGSWLGFSETFIYDQVLHQRRFVATVLARRWAKSRHQFPYSPVHTLSLPAELGWTMGFGRAHARALDDSGAQLVHAHFGLNGAFALPMLRRRPLPLAISFHGHDVGGLFPVNARSLRYRRYQRLAPELFDRASLLLTASTELADRLEELGARRSKLVVHRLGIDLCRFAYVERDAMTMKGLMVGRMVEKKGMVFGLMAFARLLAEHPEAELALIGDGPLREGLRAKAKELGLGDAVRFLGVRDAEGVKNAMQEADFFLAPSVETARGDRESGTLVVKEACATGLPVVASHHGGIPEIVEDGTTGYLVEERDVDALAERLIALARDPGLRLRLGRQSRAKMEREYDTRVRNAELEARFAELLKVRSEAPAR